MLKLQTRPSKVLEETINLQDIKRRVENVMGTAQGHNFRLWKLQKKTNIQSTRKKCVYVCACTHARLQAYACVHRGLFKLNDTSET